MMKRKNSVHGKSHYLCTVHEFKRHREPQNNSQLRMRKRVQSTFILVSVQEAPWNCMLILKAKVSKAIFSLPTSPTQWMMGGLWAGTALGL